ncbi:MAG: AAA family ATPase, partial [Natronomonas sp.]
METRVRLTVRAAEKRDAGRGVARLPDEPRRELGVLSGETIVIEGDQPTVATVWPSNDDDQTIRIDADTRSNAGITVGESVTVRPVTIDDATAVVLALPVEADESLIDSVRRELQNRPVSEGDSVRLEPPGVRATITETSPDGTVRVTERTRIQVREQPEQGPQEGSTDTASSSTVEPASTEGL